jgi:TonB family protein
MNLRHATFTAIFALAVSSDFLNAAGSSAFLGSRGTSAVDLKGVRHYGKDYPHQHPPWLDDTVRTLAPDYPFDDRARRHQGVSLFRMVLEPRTGAVVRVIMLKSTGFVTLDACAVASFRHWRWKPAKWKEIDMPITFEISPGPQRVPPDGIRLPHS